MNPSLQLTITLLYSAVQGLWAEDWQLVRELQAMRSLKEACSRDALSFSLSSLEHLSALWSPDLDVVLWLWPAVKETMSDSPLPKPGGRLSAAEGLFVSPQEMVSFVAHLCDSKGGGAGDHSLFMRFTALLCGMLAKLPPSGDVGKRVDEAVLSTWKDEDLLQLSNVGLGNFILFHLSLVWLSRTEDVGHLLLHRLASLRPSQPTCQHSAQIWAALVALLHLQLQKGTLRDPVVGGVGQLLTELATTCTSATSHVPGPLLSTVEVVMRGVVELYRQTMLPVSRAHLALFGEPLCRCVRCLVGRGRLEAVLEWVRSVIRAIGQHCVQVREGEGSAEEKVWIQGESECSHMLHHYGSDIVTTSPCVLPHTAPSLYHLPPPLLLPPLVPESLSVLFHHILPILSAQAQSPLPPSQLMGCTTELASLYSKQ